MQNIFRALNDQTRRDIMEFLKAGDKTAGEIADQFHFSKPTISHHLDLLRQAGLVISRKEGQFVYYSLNTTVTDELIAWLYQFNSKRKKK